MDIGYLPWRLAEQYGDREAIGDEASVLTFRELDRRVEAVAAQLRSLGFGPGDVLAVMLPNRAELVIALAAAWRLAGAATPVNPAFTSDEAGHQIADSGACLVITDGEAEGLPAPTLSVDALWTATSETVPPADLTGPELALLIYTSGSTGRPKGVMLDHANLEAMSSQMVALFGLTEADHCLLVLPLFHVNAIMVSTFSPLRAGGRVSLRAGFSATGFFDQVEALRPTYFSAVPAIYAMLAALPAEVSPDTSSLRFVVCGAAPVSAELLATCQKRYDFEIVEGYGLTEGTCASACNPVDGVRKIGTVGPVVPGQQLRVAGPDGADVPVGERGEVLIGGSTVMRGYLNRPEATAATVVDGWLHTGDVGVLDEDGYLRIVDRIKDMIIRGGENLYPKEIEAVIAELDEVLEVAVVGRPDPVLGEVPVAYVVTYPDADLPIAPILDHCRGRLTRVKIPSEVVVVDALPRNPVGKIDKPGLRRLLPA